MPRMQGQRQRQAVVRVKGDFGQQVGQRDAQEHARGEGQGAADDDLLLGKQPAKPKTKAIAPSGHMIAKIALARRMSFFFQPPAAISEVIERASSGLWRATARKVPKPNSAKAASLVMGLRGDGRAAAPARRSACAATSRTPGPPN